MSWRSANGASVSAPHSRTSARLDVRSRASLPDAGGARARASRDDPRPCRAEPSRKSREREPVPNEPVQMRSSRGGAGPRAAARLPRREPHVNGWSASSRFTQSAGSRRRRRMRRAAIACEEEARLPGLVAREREVMRGARRAGSARQPKTMRALVEAAYDVEHGESARDRNRELPARRRPARPRASRATSAARAARRAPRGRRARYRVPSRGRLLREDRVQRGEHADAGCRATERRRRRAGPAALRGRPTARRRGPTSAAGR